MSDANQKWTIWASYLAIALALAAIVLRLARGRVDDWTDFLGPIAIVLFMTSIVARDRRRRRGEDRHG